MRFGRVEGDKEGGEAGFHPVIKTLKPYTLNPSKVLLGEGERDCEREGERERERERRGTNRERDGDEDGVYGGSIIVCSS